MLCIDFSLLILVIDTLAHFEAAILACASIVPTQMIDFSQAPPKAVSAGEGKREESAKLASDGAAKGEKRRATRTRGIA
jgi:hypothetical protein